MNAEGNGTEKQAWRGSGLVLVIDDEEMIRQTLSMMLSFLGFEVLEAEDGPSGIACFREHQERIRVVILDMTMPGMSGDAVFAELQRIRSDVRVLLLSGYSEESLHQRFLDCGPAGFLQKPFTPQMLQQKLQQALQ